MNFQKFTKRRINHWLKIDPKLKMMRKISKSDDKNITEIKFIFILMLKSDDLYDLKFWWYVKIKNGFGFRKKQHI